MKVKKTYKPKKSNEVKLAKYLKVDYSDKKNKDISWQNNQ